MVRARTVASGVLLTLALGGGGCSDPAPEARRGSAGIAARLQAVLSWDAGQVQDPELGIDTDPPRLPLGGGDSGTPRVGDGTAGDRTAPGADLDAAGGAGDQGRDSSPRQDALAADFTGALSASGSSTDAALDVAVDGDGNSYLVGHFFEELTLGAKTLTSHGSHDLLVAKVDRAGNFVWAAQAGGSSWDKGYGVAVDSAGSCYVTGAFNGTVAFGKTTLTSAGSADIFVAKLDGAGNFVWATRAGGPGRDQGQAIALDPAGNVYVTGGFNNFGQGEASFGTLTLSGLGHMEIFVAQLDSAGAFRWVTPAGSPQGEDSGEHFESGYDIAVDPQGNSHVVGAFLGSARFGTRVLTSAGYEDIFVARLNSAGAVQWAVRAGGRNHDDTAYGVALDSWGNSYITGQFFGPQATFGSATLTSRGESDVFVAKLTLTGDLLWATAGGGGGADFAEDIAVGSAGELYITGAHGPGASFGETQLKDFGSWDVFAARVSRGGQFVWAKSAGSYDSDQGFGIALDGRSATFDATTLRAGGSADLFLWKRGTDEP